MEKSMSTEVICPPGGKAYLQNRVRGDARSHLEPRPKKHAPKSCKTAKDMLDFLDRRIYARKFYAKSDIVTSICLMSPLDTSLRFIWLQISHGLV